MFGEEFGFDYFEQRHAERLAAAERARLIQDLQAARHAEQGQRPLRKRVLAAAGNQLVSVGCRLQQVAAH